MKKRNDTKVIFKPYNQQQTMLLPPSLEELLAANHPVRVVNKVLDQIDIVPLIANTRLEAPAGLTPRCYSKYLYLPISIISTAAARLKRLYSKMFVLCG
jgi:transposase